MNKPNTDKNKIVIYGFFSDIKTHEVFREFIENVTELEKRALQSGLSDLNIESNGGYISIFCFRLENDLEYKERMRVVKYYEDVERKAEERRKKSLKQEEQKERERYEKLKKKYGDK
jgi:hypothetical protein